MKIAIPSETADALCATRSGHFGHTPYFTVVAYAERSTPNVDDAARLFAAGRVERMSPADACSHH